LHLIRPARGADLFGAEGCFAQSGGDSEVEADADKPIITELEAVVDDLREIVALVEKEEGLEQ
jgi:hypothetical protein